MMRVAITIWIMSWSCSGFAQASLPATQVRIDSRWMGMNPDAPTKTVLLIQRHGKRYELSGTTWYTTRPVRLQPRPIDTVKVEGLVNAMQQPLQTQVSKEWTLARQEQIRTALHENIFSGQSSYRLPKQKALLESVLNDPTKLRGALTKGLPLRWHTDDYPEVTVTVTLANGEVLTAHSQSQHFAMVPWKTRPGGTTFAFDIPHALALVMPATAANAKRFFTKHPYDLELTELVDAALHDGILEIAAEAGAGPALAALKAGYSVDSVFLSTLTADKSVLYATVHKRVDGIDWATRAELPLSDNRIRDEAQRFQAIDRNFAIPMRSAPLIAELKRLPEGEREVQITSVYRYDRDQRRDVVVGGWRDMVIKTLNAKSLWPDVIRQPDLLLRGVLVQFDAQHKEQLRFVLPDGRVVAFE